MSMVSVISEQPKIRPTKAYSHGERHAKLIKAGWRAKRLASKYVNQAIETIADAMTSDLPSTVLAVRVSAAERILDRAIGKAASAPEDNAALAAGATITVLTGIARLPTDVIDLPPGQALARLGNVKDAEFISITDQRPPDGPSVTRVEPASELSSSAAYKDVFGDD
jgi:hypothetical protein